MGTNSSGRSKRACLGMLYFVSELRQKSLGLKGGRFLGCRSPRSIEAHCRRSQNRIVPENQRHQQQLSETATALRPQIDAGATSFGRNDADPCISKQHRTARSVRKPSASLDSTALARGKVLSHVKPPQTSRSIEIRQRRGSRERTNTPHA